MTKNITKPGDFFIGTLSEECVDLLEEQFKEKLKENKGLSYGDEVVLFLGKTVRSDVCQRVKEIYEEAGWEVVTFWYTDQRDIKQGTYFKFKSKLNEH